MFSLNGHGCYVFTDIPTPSLFAEYLSCVDDAQFIFNSSFLAAVGDGRQGEVGDGRNGDPRKRGRPES